MNAGERVLVIPASRFRAVGTFAGHRLLSPADRDALLDPAHFEFRPRASVEDDPDYLQLIPYVVLRCGGAVFHYERAGGEARLHSRRSIGVGGHVNDADHVGDPANVYRSGMLRELAEEVEIGSPWRESGFGFVHDPSTPVGAVHLGVIHLLELDAPEVRPREAGIARCGFAPVAELARRRDEFESWSALLLDALVEV